ncbi:MAG: DUF2786 domain-containing protein [Deltaproteobacteria bacterium]|nr:DUF2786 domain-containing protein [Deltaproteobacteria bacterium]
MNTSNLPPAERSRLKNSLLRLCQREHLKLVSRFPGARGAALDLRPLDSLWGQWIPQGRVIALSERLLDQTRWLPVKGVLGHETAHQLVTDLYPLAAINEPAHGPTFISVCRRMQLDPFYWKASMSFSDLSAPPPCPLGPDAEDAELKPVLDKVKKLLALAGSDNTNESAAALSAAERILARYSIDPATIDHGPDNEPYRRLTIPMQGSRPTLRHSLILHILIEFFGVAGIYTWNYDPSTARESKEIELLGLPMNLAMAEYVWAFLNERCDTLWEAYRPQAWRLGEKGLGAKNAFMNSLLNAFTTKMKEGRRAAAEQPSEGGRPDAPPSNEVAVRHDKGLDEFVRSVFPSMGTTRHTSSASWSSPNAAGAGAAAGRKLSIRPPVGGGGNGGPVGRIG